MRARGESIRDSAAHAARLRFRPIIMTSFAFIMGVVPLMFARGAGAAGQQALGTAVFGGMVASTLLAVLFVPAFFVVTQSFSEWWGHGRPEPISGATGSASVQLEPPGTAPTDSSAR
jgi:HAE1 family hydrophobic/amphiphilic exporter-1